VAKIECPHILIVEDNPAIARIIEYSLYAGEQRYHFSHAYDGNQALVQIKALQPDLITLDLQLPGINGDEIAQRLRSEGNTTPILMLTALQDRESKIRGLQSGCDDYLTKPFAPKILRVHVEALLRRAGHALESPEPSDEERQM
jgi:DNA-binding response OmpR family regulator